MTAMRRKGEGIVVGLEALLAVLLVAQQQNSISLLAALPVALIQRHVEAE